jgi:hypothetical protein
MTLVLSSDTLQLQYQVVDNTTGTPIGAGWQKTDPAADGSASVTLDNSILSTDGPYAIEARVVDETTGLVVNGPYSSSTFTIDNTPPDGATIHSFQDGFPILQGYALPASVESGATVTGAVRDENNNPVTDASVSIGQQDADGNFLVTVGTGGGPLPPDAATLALTTTDEAGNVSTTFMPIFHSGVLNPVTYEMGVDNGQDGKDLLVVRDNGGSSYAIGSNPDITLKDFTVAPIGGDYKTTAGADRIDLSQLLESSPGSSQDVTVSNIDKYVQVTHTDGTTVEIGIDRTGSGTFTQLITVHTVGDSTTLTAADLLNQHQLIV